MRFHRFLFYLFILLLPVQLGLHFWPSSAFIYGIRIDYLSPTLYLTHLIIVAFLLLWFLQLFSQKIILTKRFALIVASMLFFVGANIFFSISPSTSLVAWVRIALIVAVALYVYHQQLLRSKWMYYCLAVALIYSSVIGLTQFFLQHSIGGWLYWLGERTFTVNTPGIALINVDSKWLLRPYSLFPHPNAFAGFLAVGTSLVIQRVPKWLSIIVLLFVVPALILSYSHGIFIALVVAFLATHIKRAPSSLLFFAIVSSLCLPIAAPWLINNFSQESVTLRAELSIASGRLLSLSGLSGVGLGSFIHASNGNADILNGLLNTSPIFRYQPVHNVFLLVLIEAGIAGLLALYAALWRGLQSKSKSVLFALVLILVTALFDHYWITLHQTALLFALVVGLAVSREVGYNTKSHEISH